MSSARIQFGPFVLDVSRYELTNQGKAVHLERIPMDLLILLLQEPGRLIGRDEIIERLWGKGVYLDADNAINTAVRKIRRALGEDSGNPQYVETVQGKGYRFKSHSSELSAIAPASVETRSRRIMLVVLPFENLSNDPSQEYFSDGLSEETIMRLGQMSPHRLGVIARTSSMAYKRTNKTVAQIGLELGVDYVLEGSVRREKDRVRITAQLVRVQDQIHLWAENFDRELIGILDIHGEIGSAIAAQVKLELMEAKSCGNGNDTRDPEAHDQYLHGRYQYARSNRPSALKAVEHFKRAIEHDSAYALAHSGLADALMILPITGDFPAKEMFPTAKSAVAQALQLDPNSAEAYTSDATAKFWYDWDFNGAETSARRAIQLNENYALAHLYLSHVLSNTGHHEEALAVIGQGLVLDPYSLIAGAMRGQFLYHADRTTEALEQFRRTLSMESRFWVGQICLAKAYEGVGKYSEALEACGCAWEFSGGNSEALSLAGYIHAVSGDRANAQAKIHEMIEVRKSRYVPPYNFALVFAGLGDAEAAIDHLEQAFEERDVHMPFLRDHKWNSMRSHLAFQRLSTRVGFHPDNH